MSLVWYCDTLRRSDKLRRQVVFNALVTAHRKRSLIRANFCVGFVTRREPQPQVKVLAKLGDSCLSEEEKRRNARTENCLFGHITDIKKKLPPKEAVSKKLLRDNFLFGFVQGQFGAGDTIESPIDGTCVEVVTVAARSTEANNFKVHTIQRRDGARQ